MRGTKCKYQVSACSREYHWECGGLIRKCTLYTHKQGNSGYMSTLLFLLLCPFVIQEVFDNNSYTHQNYVMCKASLKMYNSRTHEMLHNIQNKYMLNVLAVRQWLKIHDDACLSHRVWCSLEDAA